jgi:hypothetical protein
VLAFPALANDIDVELANHRRLRVRASLEVTTDSTGRFSTYLHFKIKNRTNRKLMSEECFARIVVDDSITTQSTGQFKIGPRRVKTFTIGPMTYEETPPTVKDVEIRRCHLD